MWMTLLALLLPSLLLPPGVLILKLQSQKQFDQQRIGYTLGFPPDLTGARMAVWIGSLRGLMPGKLARAFGMPSICFETIGTNSGIIHRLLVPAADADYIVGQLRSLIPGINVTPDHDRVREQWVAGISIRMSRPMQPMMPTSAEDMSTSLLASIATLGDKESVMIQWVITPAPAKMPPRSEGAASDQFGILRALSGRITASAEELEQRRTKLQEHNVLAAGRVVSLAETNARGRHLVDRVQKALAGMHTSSNRFKSKPLDLYGLAQVNEARTPILFDAQFSVTEAVGIFGWPIGSPYVAGLPRGAARHLHATAEIPQTGRLIGVSNVPGNERPVAVGYHEALSHTFIVGGTGSGKSALMANLFAQDVAHGYGAIVIDVGGSESHETLFSRALSYIPTERMQDVIIVDPKNGANRPVSFNVLDQGAPGVVGDQITQLFERIYGDSKSGVWLPQLIFHGLWTLAAAGGYAFTDIIPLVTPGANELAWADDIKRSVKDRDLQLFWQRWDNMPEATRNTYATPLLNRAWQLASRPETRHIIGQSKSSFQMDDVINQNKILLVNLAGIPSEAAKLIASLFMDALWNSAQRFTPSKPNFLFIDEAQLLKLPMNVQSMLQQARKHRLGVTVATQNIETLDPDVQTGVLTNALTKVIYQTEGRAARLWQGELGRKYFTEEDLARIGKYEAVAKIATESSGSSAPITLKVTAPLPTTGNDHHTVRLSSATYGRPVEQVRSEIENRRAPAPTPEDKRPPIGEW
ncbi:type IV secretory system conjugative DNA transfer family protein [Naasia lichenicola]|uniref:Uncharacterized protein n=1 Tax=Naasia lichenicola TaxID=2565933 RepID=A0A4S4FMY8_9MICO|nr:type IV secretion system DNA-binding domain-containing protein [Naasia lichenicola]THG30663.1 hypothetical protein E6C64_08465 [Naasia lichenicola]THG31900.1 hypothetical protein E6C64_07610 [Naasia lichenicola]